MLKNTKYILYSILFIAFLGGVAYVVQKIRHQFYAPPIIIPDVLYQQKQNFYYIVVDNKKHYIRINTSIEERNHLYVISTFNSNNTPIPQQHVEIYNILGDTFGTFSVYEEKRPQSSHDSIVFSTDNREQILALCRNVFLYGSDDSFNSQFDPNTVCSKRCSDINLFYFCSYKKIPVYFWEFWKDEFEYE